MELAAHLFDIAHASDITVLLAYRNDVLDSELLDATEMEEISRAIEMRITTLARKK